ncbi:MAG: rhomboid family intramembrane serine protease [Calditrichaeota bacterium]|nr:rhomboid family intramembrane serine protease [Calditrichota bacterium]
MRYQYKSPGSYDLFSWGRPRPTIIRSLIIINLALWILVTLTGTERMLFPVFGLVPRLVWSSLMVWQPFTYMFLHAGFWHVALNMFVLWMFGSELEREWGGAAFLRYYFITGVGAGLVTTLFNLNSTTPVVGASGAIYGVLLAYGLAYPNREVYLFPGLFPARGLNHQPPYPPVRDGHRLGLSQVGMALHLVPPRPAGGQPPAGAPDRG